MRVRGPTCGSSPYTLSSHQLAVRARGRCRRPRGREVHLPAEADRRPSETVAADSARPRPGRRRPTAPSPVARERRVRSPARAVRAAPRRRPAADVVEPAKMPADRDQRAGLAVAAVDGARERSSCGRARRTRRPSVRRRPRPTPRPGRRAPGPRRAAPHRRALAPAAPARRACGERANGSAWRAPSQRCCSTHETGTDGFSPAGTSTAASIVRSCCAPSSSSPS